MVGTATRAAYAAVIPHHHLGLLRGGICWAAGGGGGCAAGYGALIELIQAFLPWRSAELGDALANAVGAALGVWLGQKVHSP